MHRPSPAEFVQVRIKPVYTAVSEAAALDAFAEFSGKWEKRYPAITRLWENAWAEFVPFLRFDNEIRTIICTTKAIVIWSSRSGVRHGFRGAARRCGSTAFPSSGSKG
jgi:transposase-like protein